MIFFVFIIRRFKDEKREIDKNFVELYGEIYNIEETITPTQWFDGNKLNRKFRIDAKYKVSNQTYVVSKSIDYKIVKDSILIRYKRNEPEKSYIIIE
ncbi:MAG: hypothetical protein GXO79_13735 [Chlorobi bacterium]|nr:hypothetical protein [Chlorobiota bacterium]